MSEAKAIISPRGAGGGGKSGGGGYIASDTLASRAYAKIVLAISEGEVEGLSGGMQDVFLDGTPLENPNGTYNFSGVSFYFTPGTQSQDYVPGFSDVENEVQVSLVVLNSAPLTRSITDTNANAVRVTVNLPAIYYTNTSNGDVTGSSVDIAIDIQTNGGGYVQRVYDTISGKASQNYERSYRINLSGSGPWDIRVRRVTADSATGNPVNAVYWTSYTEIIDAKLRYPNTACAYLVVDSGQFQSVPAISLNLKGLRIQVPSNYDPVGRTYSGAWDGTFKIAWSNNPAWCFYDLLTSTRYGLGNFVSAGQVDKWTLYSIGQYCDELVPDGFGAQEPRFTLNAYIQNYASAYQVVQDLASVFRGMPFWSTGSVTAAQDAPANAVALFTAANVIDGRFTYTGSSLKGRHTVAIVTWYDMNNQAQPTPEYVSISDSDIIQYGEVITQVTAFGCTSRGQAHRVGRWILYSEKYEGETVAFKTGLDAAPVRPGDIIKIADAMRAGQRLGGRINSASISSVTVDALIVDQNGNAVNPVGNALSVIALDGSVQAGTVGQSIQGVAIQSFSRASTATYTNSAGVVVTAPVDVPRIDYSTGSPVLLVEGAGTNLCPNSIGNGGTWGSTVITLNAVMAPDGTKTGGQASDTGTGASGFTSAKYLNPAVGQYATSVWLRADSAISIGFYSIWNNSSGTQIVTSHTVTLSTAWQRFVLPTVTTQAGAESIYWQINLAAGQTVYFWGTQIEAGTAASSYIPTSGAAVTRGADVATYTSQTGLQTLVLENPLTVAPNPQALWLLELSNIQAQLFRIIQITRSERNEFTLTALAYNPSKYGYIEDDLTLVARQITDLSQPPSAPSGLVCTESLYEYQSTVFSMAAISWPAVANVNGYVFGWSRNSGNLQLVNVAGAGYDLNKTEPGTYNFQVWSIGPNGKKSSTYASLTQQLYGKTLPPSNVQGLDYGWDYNNGLVLNWAAAPDIDIAVYEVREGNDWSTATLLGQTKSTTFTAGTPAVGQTFWVAVLDTQGIYSTTPASVTPQLPTAGAPLVSAKFVGVNAIISWSVPVSTLAIDHYLISLDGGTTILSTIKGTSFSTKAIWSGTETFSVAAVDIAGTVGAWGAASLTMSLPVINSITDQVVDNNVLLKWTSTPGTLPIDHYIVAEGDAWATATAIGQTQGTFDTIFETVAGNKTYWIAGVDAAGNQGTPVALSVYVNPPPDYVLQYNLNSTWGGTQTNIVADTNGELLTPIDGTTSFQEHFLGNSAGLTPLGALTNAVVGYTETAPTPVSVSGNVITMTSQTPGADFWNTSDNGIYRYQSVTGDFTATTQVALKGSPGAWSKAGLVVRDSMTAHGCTTLAADMLISGTQGFAAQWADFSATYPNCPDKNVNGAAKGTNNYVKIQRLGQVFEFSYSTDGATWTLYNTVTFANAPEAIYIGVALIANTVACGATFTNFAVAQNWQSPNDQVNAGFPIFIEPVPLTASYVEAIDYGQVLPASNIVVTLSKTVIAGAPTTSIDIAVSSDNSTWTTYTGQSNVYVSNFRYAKITVNVSGTAGLDILRLDNLNIKYQVKQKTDSGAVACLSTDTNGTPATFNIQFLDVSSITVTPNGTTPCFAIYDFAGGASPTGFTIMLFDTSGNRISGNVSWSARGV